MKIRYTIENADGRRITDAYTVQVPVDVDSGAMRFGVPDALRQRIDRLTEELPE